MDAADLPFEHTKFTGSVNIYGALLALGDVGIMAMQ